MQSMQRLNHVAEVYAVHVGSKHAVDYHDCMRPSMLAELVRRPQHIRGLQRRAHSGKGVRHVVAQPTRGNPPATHLDPL